MVTLKSGKVFYFTPIYASPQEEGRTKLWSQLKNISRSMPGEWLLAGDFNDIATPLEKREESRRNSGGVINLLIE